ncbi:MAG: hypothetical protein V4671_21910 [Armatimonadota bacterium]
MDATDLTLFTLPVILLFMVGLFVAWRFGQNRKCVERWVRENGYELVEATDSFDGHPSGWSPRTGAAYEITVRDQQGQMRQGWIYNGYPFAEECGSIKVAWKD